VQIGTSRDQRTAMERNHHRFSRSPKVSARSGEIDPNWPLIQLLTRIKLARPCRTIDETGDRQMARLGELPM
jgi:fatty-acid desaturase